MISNTELFYVKAKEFQDKRTKIVDEYEKSLAKLERFKGSSGYTEDVKKIEKKFEEDLITLQNEYRPSFNTIFGGMMDAIGKRSISAPTDEQIRLLSVLKMRKKVSLEELARTAEAVKDNPIAVHVVTEISHDQGYFDSFDHLCPEMSSQKASDIVTSMRTDIEDFLQHYTTKASRIVTEYYGNRYGAKDLQLTKRTPFNTEKEFFKELGLVGKELEQFSDIVNDEGK